MSLANLHLNVICMPPNGFKSIACINWFEKIERKNELSLALNSKFSSKMENEEWFALASVYLWEQKLSLSEISVGKLNVRSLPQSKRVQTSFGVMAGLGKQSDYELRRPSSRPAMAKDESIRQDHQVGAPTATPQAPARLHGYVWRSDAREGF